MVSYVGFTTRIRALPKRLIHINLRTMDDIRHSLSESTKAFVDAELAEGSYASVSDAIDALVLAGAKAKAQDKLEALLLEGLEGEDIEWTDAHWDELRGRIASR